MVNTQRVKIGNIFRAELQSTPLNVNTGKENTLPYSNTSPGYKVEEKVNVKKTPTHENSNHYVITTAFSRIFCSN